MTSLAPVDVSPTTMAAPEISSDTDTIVGYSCLIVSCIAFGFMFAPLRRLDCRDGFFVQWVQCAVVFLVGLGVNVVREEPQFNLIAAIGGVLYATGNIASVPIVKGIGIGLGMLIWGSVQITVGWAVARFGLFGTKMQEVSNEAMNYAGVLLTLLSGVVFVLVQSAPSNAGSYDVASEAASAKRRSTTDESVGHFKQRSTEDSDEPFYDTVHPIPATDEKEISAPKTPTGFCAGVLTKRKLFFIFLSVCLGLLHGCMLTPIVYVQDTDAHASKNVLDFVFSHFSAVFAFSSLYFFVYAIAKCNKPFVDAQLVLPSVLYGILWSIGMVLFIVSNHKLSQTVSYPITARLPAIIGALTDVFVYRSIKGAKNIGFLAVGVAVGIAGVVLVALSNQL